MSGLLQRLARQVVGPAPLMARAHVAPRFAPGGDAAPTGDAPGVAADDAPQRKAITRPQAEAATADATRAAPATQPAPAMISTARATAATPPDTLAGCETDVPWREAMPTAPGIDHAARSHHTAPPPLLPPRAATSPPAAPHADPPRTPAAPSSAAASAIGADTDAHALAPLFAAQSGSHKPPGASAATSAGGQPTLSNRLPEAQPRDRVPNEVHVHIGRIEVTALPEAPAAKPRARGRQPMSLDEYLARRQGERR